jgi:hypothetical protein
MQLSKEDIKEYGNLFRVRKKESGRQQCQPRKQQNKEAGITESAENSCLERGLRQEGVGVYKMSPFGSCQKSNLVRKLDSILRPVVKNLEIEDGVRFSEIKKNWLLLFQKPLIYHVAPALFSEGELVLNVDSPGWLQELKFFTGDIVKKLNPYGVKTIRLRLGRVALNHKGPRGAVSKDGVCGQTARQFTPEEISYVSRTVSEIDNEDLRGTIGTVLRKAISSGRTKIN